MVRGMVTHMVHGMVRRVVVDVVHGTVRAWVGLGTGMVPTAVAVAAHESVTGEAYGVRKARDPSGNVIAKTMGAPLYTEWYDSVTRRGPAVSHGNGRGARSAEISGNHA
jgi:hypothetical protein